MRFFSTERSAQGQPGTGTAGGAPITAPNSYILDGPIEAAPYLGYWPPEVRQEALAAVLGGVETGPRASGPRRGYHFCELSFGGRLLI